MSKDNEEKNDEKDVVLETVPDTQAPEENKELAELKKQNLYLRADFENYKKQAIKERSELIKFGSEPVLREFIGVLDNLDRAAHSPVNADNLEAYKNGLELILSQFKKTLERFGVEEIPTEGQAFDPSHHDALGQSKNPEIANNVITQVFKKAYKLHGKVIRPAQVIVNSVPDSEKESAE